MAEMRTQHADGLRLVDIIVWILCGLAAAFGAWALHIGWHHSILDLHPWRQSHTALSSYEMVRGGPLWYYLTPILGPPWASPIEFPLYQWIAAVISRSLGLDLETTGRAVSAAFFLATSVPYWFALDILKIRLRHRPACLALVLVSPLYLFWSRTFMIESTALFFAVTFLAAMHRASQDGATSRQTALWLTVAIAAGVLGAMVKVTTFVPWWTGAAILVGVRARRDHFSRDTLVAMACGLVIPVLAAMGWLAFVDIVKAQNPLSARLAWSTVAWQHFGAFSLRLVPRSWYSVPGSTVLGRTRHTVIASGLVFGAAWVALSAWRGRFVQCLICLGLYVLPIAVFMHLYTMHVYYSYANGLFLLAILGSGVVALLEQRNAVCWLGVGLFTAALAAMTTNYLGGYYADQQSDDISRWPLVRAVGNQVPAADTLLIYGLDLDPEFNYAAKRRALMSWENRGAGDPAFEKSLALLAQEGGHIGALIACGDARTMDVVARTTQRLAIADRPSYRDVFCDVYFPADHLPARNLQFP